MVMYNPKKKSCSSSATRVVSHFGLAIYIKKVSYDKRRLMENSNILPCKNIIFKKSSKRNPKSFKIL